MTFILLALGKLLSHVEFRAKADIHIIMIGLYFGIATLFYLSYIFIIPISMVILGLFSTTVLRRYFLLLISSTFPLFAAFLYYWVISDQPVYFIRNLLYINLFDQFYSHIGWYEGGVILSFSLFFMILGLVSIGKQRRLNNYQFRIVQLFFILGVLMLGALLLEKPITHYTLVMFLPIATYFTIHFTALFKRPLYILVLNLVLFFAPITLMWGIANTWWMQTSTLPARPSLKAYESIIKGRRIMVLGSAKSLFTHAELAGPFYDWGLSKSFFNNLDYYDNLIFLQNQLIKSSPDIIIDLENNWHNISKRLPMVSKQYYLSEPNVWVRKN